MSKKKLKLKKQFYDILKQKLLPLLHISQKKQQKLFDKKNVFWVAHPELNQKKLQEMWETWKRQKPELRRDEITQSVIVDWYFMS